MTNPNSDPNDKTVNFSAKVIGEVIINFFRPANKPIPKIIASILTPLTLYLTYANNQLADQNNKLTYANNQLADQNNKLTSQGNQFEEDQRAVEVTLQLATYWETNLDTETRRRSIRVVENKSRKKILTYLAKPENELNSQDIKKDRDILHLVKLEPNTNNLELIDEAILYRVALTRVLNTMESLANIRIYTKGKITNEIIDEGYKCTFKARYEQLKPFVDEFRKNQSKTAWKPIDTVIQEKWKTFDECK